MDIKAARQGFDQLGANYPSHNTVQQQYETIAGINCCWFYPDGVADDDIVFYVHGGAFILGSFASHAALISHISAAIRKKILLIDYRLAPEHPFPAGLDDLVTVIRTYTVENPAVRFGIIGDSAGGNLTMAIANKLLQLSLRQADWYVVISPWVDLTCSFLSYALNKDKDPILDQAYLQETAALYAGAHSLDNELLSPIHADFRGLNPVLILCGSLEILENDAAFLHQHLLKAGVNATYHLFENEVHVWPMMDIYSKGSQAALESIRAFIYTSNTKG